MEDAPENAPREWYSRGYLPHRDCSGVLQAITYRLADSLPSHVLAQIELELKLLPPGRRSLERRKRLEAWLDAGHGSCVLRMAENAECVVGTWRRFAGERYDLIAWVVMPNHVHVLIRVYDGMELGKIVQSWKSYTGRRIGQAWLKEYWDRFVRDEKHFHAVMDYIHENPVKAGLAACPSAWPWSSAKELQNAELGLGAPRGAPPRWTDSGDRR